MYHLYVLNQCVHKAKNPVFMIQWMRNQALMYPASQSDYKVEYHPVSN